MLKKRVSKKDERLDILELKMLRFECPDPTIGQVYIQAKKDKEICYMWIDVFKIIDRLGDKIKVELAPYQYPTQYIGTQHYWVNRDQLFLKTDIENSFKLKIEKKYNKKKEVEKK